MVGRDAESDRVRPDGSEAFLSSLLQPAAAMVTTVREITKSLRMRGSPLPMTSVRRIHSETRLGRFDVAHVTLSLLKGTARRVAVGFLPLF
jgi:hypothetical protein